MNAAEHIAKAEHLLRGHIEVYNGGQTRVEKGPSERECAESQAHSALAQAKILIAVNTPVTYVQSLGQ